MSSNTSDRERRTEVAREALDVGMDDPYWLHNLSRVSAVDPDLTNAEEKIVGQLREDAERLETAHQKVEDGEWVPAEAALYVAEGAHFGDYDTREHLYDGLPIDCDDAGGLR